MDWKNIGSTLISKGLPLLGAIVGGPAGGTLAVGVSSLLSSALNIGDGDLTPDKMMEVIADPQAVMALRELESNNSVELQKLLLTQEQAYLQDRASARSREIEIAKVTGKRDVNLYLLAWLMVLGFFALCGVLMVRPVPTSQNQILFMLFGTLATAFGAVIQYFFGSSKSSNDKTKLMAMNPKE